MKSRSQSFLTVLAATGWMCVAGFSALDAQTSVPVGPGSTLVHSQFGGQIFGFDIDQNGTEGVLSEAQDIAGGKVLAAVETFDQATGKILKVVRKIETKGRFPDARNRRNKCGPGGARAPKRDLGEADL
jgi:hypothetical protein